MQTRFEPRTAPIPPLRAEPRPGSISSPPPLVRQVQATSGGLIRATLGSGLAASAILFLFWLPAEYGIDPTGFGRTVGLTQMGEIKQQLYDEAAADQTAQAATTQAAAPPPAIGTDPLVLDRLTAIETQVAAIAAVIGAVPEEAAPAADEPVATVEEPAAAAAEPIAAAEAPTPGSWRDEVSYTLPPGEGVEIKLVMQEGAQATFEWTANGSVVNFETHGDDGAEQNVTYEQGRATPDQTGTLTAAFTGNHGWFWRNRTEAPVTLTLRTAGDYAEMKAP